MMKSIFKTFFLSLCIVANTHFAFSQTASILPPAKTTFLDQNGKPLTSGTVDFYIPGTTTRKTTWIDSGETTPNTNPVKLDAAGRAIILGDGSYRQVVKDRNGNLIWDQVTASASGGSGGGGGTTIGIDNNVLGTVLPFSGLVVPSQYVLAYGQTISRTTYAPYLAVATISQAITCVSGSPILTSVPDTSQISAGAAVESPCLPSSTVVISKTSTTVTLNNNATVNINSTARFFPYGNGDGITTFNVPDMRGKVLAGRNNMGGAANSILTSTYYGLDPNAIGINGGNQSTTIVVGNLPPYTPTGTVSTTVTPTVTVPVRQYSSSAGSNDVTHMSLGNNAGADAGTFSGTASSPASSTFAGVAQGGTSTAISRIQPTITINYIVKIIPNLSNPSAGTLTAKQDFIAGTDFTPGSTVTLNLANVPFSGDSLLIFFDGVNQSGKEAATWTVSPTGVVTFNAAIPSNVQVVEAVTLPIGGTGGGGSGAGVLSFNSRTGVVIPMLGDYGVALITGAAPLASPPLTGTPTAPTAIFGTNTTQLATTAFVQSAVAGSIAGVASFNSRTGIVVASSGDYSIGQITGPVNLTLTGNGGITGNLPVTNLNGGTSANGTTFWRGDGTWSTPSGSGGSSFGYIYDATSASTGAGTDGNTCAMRAGATSGLNAIALNNCITAHTAVGIPAGRYLLCGANIGSNGQGIIGAGINATVLICDSPTGNIITVGANIFNIDGLWLDRCTNTGCGTIVTSTAGAGIGYTGAAMGCNLCTVRNIVSQNQWNGFALPPAAAGVLENLTAQNNFNDGFYFTANATYTGNQYSANGLLSQANNRYGYNTDTGGLVSTGTTWMIANGVSTYLNGAGGAYFFGTSGSSISDVQINGGFFSNDNNHLMAFINAGAGSEHNILRGLLMEGAGRCAGGNCGRNSAFVAPSNNGAAIVVSTSGMEFIIENNAMRGNSSYGVFIDNGVSRVIISGNAISQNAVHLTAYGIQITDPSTTAIISNNMGTDYGSETYGLYVGSGTNSVISGNAMGGSTAGCLVAAGTAKGAGTNIGTGCP